jgi:hypothetical protein
MRKSQEILDHLKLFFLLSIYGVIKDFVAWGGMGHPTNSIKRESKVMFMSEIDQE